MKINHGTQIQNLTKENKDKNVTIEELRLQLEVQQRDSNSKVANIEAHADNQAAKIDAQAKKIDTQAEKINT